MDHHDADESVEQAGIHPSSPLAGPYGDRIALQRLSGAAKNTMLAVAVTPFPSPAPRADDLTLVPFMRMPSLMVAPADR